MKVATISERPPERDGWYPDLNPTQDKFFNDPRRYLLASGEKGGGKSHATAEKIIRHLHDEENALGWIISTTHLPGQEGIWYAIENRIAPKWTAGLKVDFKFHYDRKSKHNECWVSNRHGGLSKLILFSVPYPSQIRTRCKGPEPSIVDVEEVTDCLTEDYFRYPAAQLGRRPGIVGPQQWLGSCNPGGPSHWVYKKIVAKALAGNPRYGYYHFQLEENLKRLPPDYKDNIQEVYGDDITARQRFVEGIWVDAPSGNAIYRDYFIPELHVQGNAANGEGLMPVVGLPIIVGYDLGPVNFSCHFMQIIPSRDMAVWIVFDEINTVGQQRGYHTIVPLIEARMEFWRKEAQFNFVYEHIADDTAFNVARTDGSFDAAEFERLSKGAIRFKACPRAKESVSARVRLMQGLFQQQAFYVSALCTKTLEMFRLLESELVPPGGYDPHAGFKPKRSPYVHSFDSLTYPVLYYNSAYRRYQPNTKALPSQAYRCGQAA